MITQKEISDKNCKLSNTDVNNLSLDDTKSVFSFVKAVWHTPITPIVTIIFAILITVAICKPNIRSGILIAIGTGFLFQIYHIHRWIKHQLTEEDVFGSLIKSGVQIMKVDSNMRGLVSFVEKHMSKIDTITLYNIPGWTFDDEDTFASLWQGLIGRNYNIKKIRMIIDFNDIDKWSRVVKRKKKFFDEKLEQSDSIVSNKDRFIWQIEDLKKGGEKGWQGTEISFAVWGQGPGTGNSAAITVTSPHIPLGAENGSPQYFIALSETGEHKIFGRNSATFYEKFKTRVISLTEKANEELRIYKVDDLIGNITTQESKNVPT